MPCPPGGTRWERTPSPVPPTKHSQDPGRVSHKQSEKGEAAGRIKDLGTREMTQRRIPWVFLSLRCPSLGAGGASSPVTRRDDNSQVCTFKPKTREEGAEKGQELPHRPQPVGKGQGGSRDLLCPWLAGGLPLLPRPLQEPRQGRPRAELADDTPPPSGRTSPLSPTVSLEPTFPGGKQTRAPSPRRPSRAGGEPQRVAARGSVRAPTLPTSAVVTQKIQR